MTAKGKEFLGPLDLIKNSLKIYKSKWKNFIWIGIIPNLFLFAIPTLLRNKYSLSQSLICPLIVIMFLVIFIYRLALYFAVIEGGKEGIDINEAYRLGWKKLVSYLWIGFVMYLILLGGFMLFVIPFLIFSVWFTFAGFVLVDQNERGLSALLKSRELVRGRFIGVFWRELVLMIVYFIPIILAHILTRPLSPLFPFIGGLAGQTVVLFTLPIFITYQYLMYRNLVDLRGQIDLSQSDESKSVFMIAGSLGIIIMSIIAYSLIVSAYISHFLR